jgi:integrase
MCWCGLRWEEAAGLSVEAVSWLRREVTVSTVVAGRRVKPYPKRAASNRTVRMAGPVAELLERPWQAASDARGRDGLLWLAGDGRPLSYKAWNAYWRDHVRHGAARSARPDVPYHPAHVLRHTGASWLAQAGVPLADIGRWLGHGPGSKATARYAHLCPERSNATIGEALRSVDTTAG